MKCRKILLVEDDESIRDVIEFALTHHGYSVTFAANGEEALRQLHDSREPYLILLDLMMPVMDGWELAKHMSLDSRLDNYPIVVLTASGENIESIPFKEILKKPIDVKRLYETVDRYAEHVG